MWMHPHTENFMETNTNTPEANQPASAGCHPTPCSPSLCESKVEEIISALWAIVWATLWAAGAPKWVLWIFGVKAALDFFCVIYFSIREILQENAKLSGSEGGKD